MATVTLTTTDYALTANAPEIATAGAILCDVVIASKGITLLTGAYCKITSINGYILPLNCTVQIYLDKAASTLFNSQLDQDYVQFTADELTDLSNGLESGLHKALLAKTRYSTGTLTS